MDHRTVPARGVWLFPDASAPVMVGHAVQAERLGLDAWWLGDEGPARDPFSVLAAAAMATSRIRLAVGIANPYSRHPGLTATTAHTVHELSGGRFVLGLGAGGDMALGPFGLHADAPLSAIRRAVRIARAVGARESTEGYEPQGCSVYDDGSIARLPVYVGARGRLLNTLASEVADGAFVAGIPPLLYPDVIGWVRSKRPVKVALYPSVAFGAEDADKVRAQMIWALMNAPDATRQSLGLDDPNLAAAATALRTGDEAPARRIMTDELLAKVLVLGSPADVGAQLAQLVTEHHPDEIGLALGSSDVTRSQEQAAEAFEAMAGVLTGAAA